MLELRPNCECCDQDLPADTAVAYLCSFECTFCAELVRRPHPASIKRVFNPALKATLSKGR